MNGFSDFSILERGGPIMWPLLILSILGFIFFIERTLYLHKGQIGAASFLEGIKNLLRKRRLLEALTVCEETPGPIPSVVKAALLNYDQGPERMRAAVEEAAIIEIPALERRIGTIAAIAKIAPLLGLLGTLVALLQAFTAMGRSGPYTDASTFSLQISQALITTVIGLAIAVMAHLAHHFLHGRVRALVHDMEWAANQIMQFLQLDVSHPDSVKGSLRPVAANGDVANLSPVRSDAVVPRSPVAASQVSASQADRENTETQPPAGDAGQSAK